MSSPTDAETAREPDDPRRLDADTDRRAHPSGDADELAWALSNLLWIGFRPRMAVEDLRWLWRAGHRRLAEALNKIRREFA